MPCEQQKQALIEAAASGTSLPGTLRQHLDVCALCSAAYADEQALLAAIDDGMRRRANAEVPPRFVPSVRASLPDSEPVRRYRFAFAFAITLGIIIAGAMSAKHLRTREAQQTVEARRDFQAPSPISSVSEEQPKAIRSQPPAGHNAHKLFRAAQFKNATNTAEVLVPPEEREAFRRFVAERQADEPMLVAFVRSAAPESYVRQKEDTIFVAPLEVKELQVKALDPAAENPEESGSSR